MSEKVIREKTKYKNIYLNTNTKKYDVKYNYKVYNPLTKKNEYKSKWVYNLLTIADARQQLALLQTGQIKTDDKDITLEGAYELWKIKADAKPFSPVTLRNTEQHMQMIYQFLPRDTKLKDITEEVYYKFSADCRKHGYAEETLYSINATFRKMMNLSYKKKLIKENILHSADNIKTVKDKSKSADKLIKHEEFVMLDTYFNNNKFIRLGEDCYPRYRLLFNILYYTGMRIGEALALTYADFTEFSYYTKGTEPLSLHIPSTNNINGKHLRGMRVSVVKAYVSEFKLTKSPKNIKKRHIPLYPTVERLFIKFKNKHLANGGSLEDRVFPWQHGACGYMLRNACDKVGIKHYTCHDFRHTFISNLIRKGVPLPVIEEVSGDEQATILERYSHLFEMDEVMVLTALSKLE